MNWLQEHVDLSISDVAWFKYPFKACFFCNSIQINRMTFDSKLLLYNMFFI